MIELLLKLIDRCIQLVKQRESQNKAIHDNFLEPLIEAFQKVHEDYVAGFSKYRDRISSTESVVDSVNELLVTIKKDALYSHDIRSQLRAMWTYRENEELAPLISVISWYLDDALLNRYGMEVMPSNRIRTGACAKLQHLQLQNMEANDLQRSALQILDGTIDEIQVKYAKVMHEYQQLKTKLLMPK